MRYSVKDLLLEIDESISEVKKELSERRSGIPGNGNVLQLEFIIDELEQIRQQAQDNTLPPKEARYTAFSWYAVDEWDLDSPLGNKLCRIANIFKRRL